MAKSKKSKKETINAGINIEKSLLNLADSLVSASSRLMREAKTEEDLRIGFEKSLEPILKTLGIKISPRYERSSAVAKTVYRGRPDAVHGQVIIEYEPPRSFSAERKIKEAYAQLVDKYIPAEAQNSKITKIMGVGFDGKTIFFVRYLGNKDKIIDKTKFRQLGPYPFAPESARTLLIHLRALARLPLTAENLAIKFGPESELAPKAVSAFANALEYWGDERQQTRVRTFFNEWKRLFGVVYGEQFSGQQEKEAVTLSTLYQVGKETDFQELLFSVHTYFAFLMKLIAAELLTLKETTFSSSFSHQLTHTSKEELHTQLADIEEGGIYAKRGITNFLEGDFFRWYLDAFSPGLEDAIREIARGLSEFEPATTTIDPESTRDLLKKLYQYLVPQQVRHKLGEYYTPDWLAELVLNEVGYNGNTLKRFLDPACGSGTFLVLAIQRAKEYGKRHKEPPLETAKRIVANIWGFDLNPLAVITARTNYLFALGDLANELQSIEIPIYLTDSVLTPTRTTGSLFGEFLEVSTSVGKFQVPAEWVRDGGFLLANAAPLVEEMVKNQYSVDEAMERFKKEGLIFSNNEQIVKDFYSQILELEKQNKNGIWARFLKNAFAPMIAGKFDFVVGNPPWIRWGYLSKEYRDATINLWKDYGLFSLKGHAARLGGGEKDFSMLFAYAAADYYLKKDAKLGFLITQEVFKSKGAGEGFRRFRLGQRLPLRVLKAHDLVSVQPFEGAANKTAAIVLKKGTETSYPVPYMVWNRQKGIGKIPTDIMLEDALPMLKKSKLIAQPISKLTGSWQTIKESQKDLRRIEGINAYKAHEGGYLVPYGVFWLELKQLLSDGRIIIKNLAESGKWKVQQVEDAIESDLVFPGVRGADIQRWQARPGIYVIISQDPKLKYGYPEDKMKAKWPRTYAYLLRFREELANRAMYKKYHGDSRPFYSQYNIAEYSFARYRVVWKHMASDMFAAVISQFKTPFGYKPIVSTHTTSLIATETADEAYYICAIINSRPVREFIKSYSAAGRGFGAPSIMNHIGLQKFDLKNPLHQKLANISQKCHQLKSDLPAEASAQAGGKEKEIEKLENQNNELVQQLFEVYKYGDS